jgi:hypothetical protein
MRKRGAFRTTTLALAVLAATHGVAVSDLLARQPAPARTAAGSGAQSDDDTTFEVIRLRLRGLFRILAAMAPGAGGVADNAPNLIVDVPDPVGISTSEDPPGPPPPPTEDPEENQAREKGSEAGEVPVESGYILIL